MQIISKFLLKIFSLFIFSISFGVKLEYEMSSHSSFCNPNRIYETISVDSSVPTKFKRLKFILFRHMAKIPYFVTPVPPINNYLISFKCFPIVTAPFDFIWFLKVKQLITLKYAKLLNYKHNFELFQ